ncbi:MAG: lamin tail domain-containing protein [Pseudomonadota bacterium]
MRYLTISALILFLVACSSDSTNTPQKDKGVQGPDATTDTVTFDMGIDLPGTEGQLPSDAVPTDAIPTETIPTETGPQPDFGPIADAGLCSPPLNDECSNAESISLSGSTVTASGTTECATDTLNLAITDCTGWTTPGYDAYFQVTLPAGSYTVTLKNSASFVDPALYVLSACGGYCVVGSDTAGDFDEEVTLSPTASTTYVIVVDSYDPSQRGDFSLEIVKSGPAPDGGPTPDTTPTPDAGPQPDSGSPAQIVITEIMANPAAVGDDVGEWFEIYNAGSNTVNLHNWVIKDNDQDSHTISSSLPIAPGQYLVLGCNDNTNTNGGVNVDYSYGANWYLANYGDEIVITNSGGTVVDTVEYTSSWGILAGASLSLKTPALDNNVSSNWCQEASAWTGSAGDNGTPGAQAGCP